LAIFFALSSWLGLLSLLGEGSLQYSGFGKMIIYLAEEDAES
jgi:hypothetical protein